MDRKVKSLGREITQDLRVLIADGLKSRAQAKRTERWSEVATESAYVDGLKTALEVVRIALGHYDANG